MKETLKLITDKIYNSNNIEVIKVLKEVKEILIKEHNELIIKIKELIKN